MNQNRQPRPLSLEDIFAEAAERVQAGEPVDAVIASYAPEFHKPLRGLLPIVETASQLHQVVIPTRATERRSANRQKLLQAAAQKRAESTTVASIPVPKAPIATTPTLGERLLATWASFLAIFAPKPMQWAMTIAALLVLLFGPTTLVTQAQSAIPGDLTYPVKQWIRAQELAFTPLEQLAEVRRQQEEEYRADVKKAQVKAAQQNRLISAHAMLVFHGYVGEYWQIGSLHVMPYYHPDLSKTERVQMIVSGDLQPGAVVMLTYQIEPDQEENSQDMPVVHGITLEVMKQQPTEQEVNEAGVGPTAIPTFTLTPLSTATPLPTATDTPEPTVTYEPPPTCTATVPAGWVPYNPQAGETAASIAERFGVSLDELRAANCLPSEEPSLGEIILVPNQGEVTTPEPGSTAVITATVTSAAPITVISPTVVMTGTSIPVATVAITVTGTPLTTPAPPLPTTTGVVTPTVIMPPAGTPLGTVVPLSTTVAGPTTTPGATPEATVTPNETPPLPTTSVTPAATDPPTTPVATTTEAAPTTPTETPTEEGVSGASFTPTAEPPTVEPVATEPPPTEPPTAVPEPPTATPLPAPTEPPPPTDTPAAASEGVMAAEAVPTDAVEPAGQPEATEPRPPEPISQPESPLPKP